MSVFKEFHFRSSNGKSEIYACRWEPEGAPKGIVHITHGVAEHIGRYKRFADYMTEHGFIVVGSDLLGHGKSINHESELGYFGESGGWNFVVSDLRQLHLMTAQEFPDLPYFMFGHSMGSFIVRTYIIYHRSGVAGAILSGTAQQRRVIVSAGALIGQAEIRKHGASYRSQKLNDLAFGKRSSGSSGTGISVSDWLSRDEAEISKYDEDHYCGFIPSAGLFRDMVGGLSFISSPRNLKRMKKDLPVIFISGDADPIGELGAGVIRAYRSFLKAGMTDVTMKLYHECRHELLNEINRDEVQKDILAWIHSKIDK